jgi:non-ribosomal peptide synthetase component F
LTIPADLMEPIRRVAREERATLFMAALAAFDILLAAESGQEDIVVGSPIANRTRVETEPLIGFFSNTIVLRADLSGNPSFREIVRRVRESAIGAYAHQDLPFEKIVEVLRPARDPSRNPIFQVNFRLGAAPERLELEGMDIEPVSVDPGISRFDLAIDLVATFEGLTGYLEYDTALFTPQSAARMSDELFEILRAAGRDPDLPMIEYACVRSHLERSQKASG